MTRFICGWDGASNCRICHNPLQKKLRPRTTIKLFAPDQLLDVAQSSRFIMSDPGVTNAPLLLPFAQRHELCIHIDQIMYLHQIDSVRAKERQGTLHRLNPILLSPSPNFCRQKELLPNPKRRCELANHLLSTTIHWG